MTLPGRFISFEGIDGAGKSSHIEAVATWLRDRGRVVAAAVRDDAVRSRRLIEAEHRVAGSAELEAART